MDNSSEVFPFAEHPLPEGCSRYLHPFNPTNGSIYFDSRKIPDYPNPTIFVAIKSTQRDGHAFINDAYQKGCRCFIVNQKDAVPADASYILCPDSVALLQYFAQNKRLTFNYPVVAISGSNGKTVVKEWLLELISPNINLSYNQKSHNSQLGVATSLLQAPVVADLGIFEAGISQKNEMVHLEQMLQPNFGILTNIGNSHLENFKNREELLGEKLKLYTHCQYLLCKYDDYQSYAEVFARSVPHVTIITWGDNEADISINFQEGLAFYGNQRFTFIAPPLGELWLENLGTCIAFALLSGLVDDYFINQIQHLTSIENRMALSSTSSGYFILNDSYSLDLLSLEDALLYFENQIKREKKLVVLSSFDGTDKSVYVKACQLLNQYKPDILILLGEEWKAFSSQLENIKTYFFNHKTEVLDACLSHYNSHSMLFKGARIWRIETVVEALLKLANRSYLEINLAAIRRNVARLKNQLPAGTKFLAMLKAEAYGGGLQRMAKSLQNAGVDYFGVAFTQEAIALREAGVRLPILVIHPFAEDLDLALRYNLELSAYSTHLLDEWQQRLAQKNAHLKIHLEIETGMHRQGIAIKALEKLKPSAFDRFTVNGCMSHLAEASLPESGRSKKQVAQFKKALSILSENGIKVKEQHLLNSDGIKYSPEYAFSMVRSGLSLFGLFDGGEFALRLASSVSHLHTAKKGDFVGYGNKNCLEADAQIALVPLGYADAIPYGVNPKKFKVKIKGRLYPLAADVCMDMIMVNVGSENIKLGDSVDIIYNKDSLNQLAKASNTLSYEILSRFSQRVQRIFTDE